MWIYAKDQDANVWKIDYEIIRDDMAKTLCSASPVKTIYVQEGDVLDWAMDNAHTFQEWILIEQAAPELPGHLTFAMVIVDEVAAMPKKETVDG